MGFDNIGLGILGAVSLIAILGTGLHFQPIIHNNDIHKTRLFQNIIDSLIYPNSPTKFKQIHHTYACLNDDVFVLVNDSWVFVKDNTRAIQLTDIPTTITRQRTGYYLGRVKPLIESQITVLDKNKNTITSSFIDELTRLSNQYPFSKSEYDFYKNACIPVRYLEYRGHYYIHSQSRKENDQ